MAETAEFRGEGGSIFTFDLPLSPDFQKKVDKGYLRMVVEDADVEVTVERPAQSAPKDKWVAYAVHTLGLEPDTAEAMTKADLIEYQEAPDAEV